MAALSRASLRRAVAQGPRLCAPYCNRFRRHGHAPVYCTQDCVTIQ